MCLQKLKVVLQVSGNKTQKFKCLGVVFTSDGKRIKQIDWRIGKTNAVQLYHHVVTKREL